MATGGLLLEEDHLSDMEVSTGLPAPVVDPKSRGRLFRGNHFVPRPKGTSASDLRRIVW